MTDRQLLSGMHCVLEALRAGRRPLHRLFWRAGTGGSEIERVTKLASGAGIPVVRLGREEFQRLASELGDRNPQGVALEAGPLPEVELDDLCDGPAGRRRLVALDGVEDPQNVGAIVRVAEAFGAQGLVLTRRRAPGLTPALARASAGAVEWLPVARVANLGRALNHLKEKGFWILGADPEATEDLFAVPDRTLRGDLLVVFGAEGRGLRPGIRELIDHPVRIPTQGRVESLNVAAAAAIVLFELERRLGRGPGS